MNDLVRARSNLVMQLAGNKVEANRPLSRRNNVLFGGGGYAASLWGDPNRTGVSDQGCPSSKVSRTPDVPSGHSSTVTPLGDTVNLASPLQARAKAEAVLLSETIAVSGSR